MQACKRLKKYVEVMFKTCSAKSINTFYIHSEVKCKPFKVIMYSRRECRNATVQTVQGEKHRYIYSAVKE
jgi:hypothetical protein